MRTLLKAHPDDAYVKSLTERYRLAGSEPQSHILSREIWLRSSDGSKHEFAPGDSLHDSFVGMQSWLSQKMPDVWSICALAAPIHNELPQQLLSQLVQSCWQMTLAERASVAKILKHPIVVTPTPESALAALLEKIEQNGYPDTAVDHLPSDFSNIANISFAWRRNAPVFAGDYDVYIQQPFNKRPRLDSLQSLILKAHPDRGRRAFIVTSSPSVLNDLDESFSTHEQVISACNDHLYAILLPLADCVSKGLQRFLEESVKILSQMVRGCSSLMSFRQRATLMSLPGAPWPRKPFWVESAIPTPSPGNYAGCRQPML